MKRPPARILVVDDDPAILRGVGGMLRDEGFEVVEARDVAEADRRLHERAPPDLMLLDLRMPGETGLAFLERLRPLPLPVVVLSGEASPTDAVSALRLGAADFVEKPPSPERLLTSLRNALKLARLSEEHEDLRQSLAGPGNLVGDSQALAEVRSLIARVGPTEAVVLIQGETGVGKERVARALHLASGRRGRFVAINCAAIPASLLESELFGHERGAFTGANVRRLGRFEQADGGTLLLDEIGDMPLELQAKLLRVLEQREIERLGGGGPDADRRARAGLHPPRPAPGGGRGPLPAGPLLPSGGLPSARPGPARPVRRPGPAAARVRRRAGGARGDRHDHARGGGRPPRPPLAGQRARAAQLRRAPGAAAWPRPPADRRSRHHRARLRRSAAAGAGSGGVGPRPIPSPVSARRATGPSSTTSSGRSSAPPSSAPSATWPPPPACCGPTGATCTAGFRRSASTSRAARRTDSPGGAGRTGSRPAAPSGPGGPAAAGSSPGPPRDRGPGPR